MISTAREKNPPTFPVVVGGKTLGSIPVKDVLP